MNNINNYRGITLLSHIAKLFTSLFTKRLLHWSDRENIVSDAQYDFKLGYGTRDAIVFCLAIFKDYRGVFDLSFLSKETFDTLWTSIILLYYYRV